MASILFKGHHPNNTLVGAMPFNKTTCSDIAFQQYVPYMQGDTQII